MDNHLKRSIGLGSALSIIVGTIIGSGIFFKQASVLDSAGSTFMALLAWILAGIITLTAGLTIAEIGAQMPYTGGLYVYIEKIYGRVLGFMAGWMQAIVYGPAMIAAVTGFLSIMVTNLFGIGTEWRIPIGLITIIAIGGLNFLENKVGAAFAIITTIAKMIPIFAIIFCGICWGEQNAVAQTVTELNRSTGGLGVAVLAALFAYDGWIFIANLGGEIKNPQKLLPKAIIIGITTVLVIYALITIGIFSFIPADKIHIPYKGEKVENVATAGSADNSQNSGSTSSSSPSNQGDGTKINLNTANVTELQKLTGIGQKKAEQIIAYREQNGSFKKIEDLMQVSGIGEKTFASLKDQLAV